MSEKAGEEGQVFIEHEYRVVEHDRSLYGVLADAVTREVDDEDWEKVRKEAWDERRPL